MLPIPTESAWIVAAAAALAIALGALLGAPLAMLLGVTLLVGLAAALAATMPLGRRVRRERLEFAWWLAHGDPGAGGGAAVPGAPFEVRCFVRHRGEDRLVLSDLEPILPAGARLADDAPRALVLWPRARTQLSFRLVAPAAGRVVLHGLAVLLEGPLGLFSVPLYFPNPLVIKVLPQAAARVRGSSHVRTGQNVERSGAGLHEKGGGTELKELREMLPGDPFKQIAWKPSARRGRLLVREVEQEVQETRYVVCDVSGTMRGGEPGSRKLDWAIEAIAAEARRALASGDRFGLVTVDGRVLAHVPQGDGSAQTLRVFDALLAATEVVDEDLTSLDDDELVALVGQYVRRQDGVDFSTGTTWNVPGLLRHVGAALAEVPGREEPVVARSPPLAALRRFCRVRGIPLPYRSDPRDGQKGPGLALALREVDARARGPAEIQVVTDLDAIGSPEVLVNALRMARLRGHTLTIVVIDSTSFVAPDDSPLSRQIFDIYARGERRRARDVAALVRPLGVRLRVVGKSEPTALALHRARRGAGAERRVA